MFFINQIEKCCICGDPMIEKDGYKKCSTCERIAFSRICSNETIYERVTEYMDRIQDSICKSYDILHGIELRAMSGQKLSTREIEIIENTTEFQKIVEELRPMIKSRKNLKENNNGLIYRLSAISDLLDDFYG